VKNTNYSDSQNTTISVIIPTYKPQDYILECLQSLNNQSFDKNKFEIIIVLNGEQEPYHSFISNCLSQCNFQYELIYTNIAGVSNARNVGIEQSKGKYLTFIDDDDLISENYLQGLYDIAKNGLIPLSYIKAFVENISNEKNFYITDVYEKMKNKNLNVLNTRSYFSTPYCKLIPRDMIGAHRFPEKLQNNEDVVFMFAISDKKMKMQFTDKTAVYYRRTRDNSLVTRKVSLAYTIKNRLKSSFAIIVIYLKSPTKYSFLFMVSRILGLLKTIVVPIQ